MKKILTAAAALLLLLWANGAAASGPLHIGGFKLGEDIEDYRDKIRVGSEMEVRHMEYLTEVEVKDSPWFESGLLYYADCAEPGKIVWIKLKYVDRSKEFFDKLLKRFKERFGEPDVWRGDPFKVVIAWKWSFNEGRPDQISMILQHNTKDAEEKMGNVIKLKLSEALRQERLCYKKSHEEPGDKDRRPPGKPDWDILIPH